MSSLASPATRVPTDRRDRTPRPKPARSIRWVSRPTAEKPCGVCRITCGMTIAAYYVTEFAAADGRGFELEKIDGPATGRERYHVYLARNGQDRSCDCKGFTRWGHCKHADGLTALLAADPAPRCPDCGGLTADWGGQPVCPDCTAITPAAGTTAGQRAA